MYEEGTNDGVKRTLIGTVSAGLSCGKNTPSWYTRVSFRISLSIRRCPTFEFLIPAVISQSVTSEIA